MTIVTRELWEQIKGSPLDTIWQERRRDGQNYRESHYNLTDRLHFSGYNKHSGNTEPHSVRLVSKESIAGVLTRVAGGGTEFLTRHSFTF